MSKIKENKIKLKSIPEKKARLEDFFVLGHVDSSDSPIKIGGQFPIGAEGSAGFKKKDIDVNVSDAKVSLASALQKEGTVPVDDESNDIKSKKDNQKKSIGIDSKVNADEDLVLDGKDKKDKKLVTKDKELDYRRNLEQARAYEESFKAYQRIMNEYFKGSMMNSYSKKYDSSGNDGSKSNVLFDVTENRRQEMIRYTKELFKNRTYSSIGDPRMDAGRKTDYEIWKSLSALNLALSFIYYDRPAMIDSLGNNE